MNLINGTNLKTPVKTEEVIYDFDVFMKFSEYEKQVAELDADMEVFDAIVSDYNYLNEFLELAKRDYISRDLLDFIKPTLEHIGYEVKDTDVSISEEGMLDKIKQACEAIWKWIKELLIRAMDLIDVYISGGSQIINSTVKRLQQYQDLMTSTTKMEDIKMLKDKSEAFLNATLTVNKVVLPKKVIDKYPTFMSNFINTCSKIDVKEFILTHIDFEALLVSSVYPNKISDFGIAITISGDHDENSIPHIDESKSLMTISPKRLGFSTLGNIAESINFVANDIKTIEKSCIEFKRRSVDLLKKVKGQYEKELKTEESSKTPDPTKVKELREHLSNISVNMQNMLRYVKIALKIGALSSRTLYIVINEHNKNIFKYIESLAKDIKEQRKSNERAAKTKVTFRPW